MMIDRSIAVAMGWMVGHIGLLNLTANGLID